MEGAGLAPAPPPRAFVNTMATQVARCVAPPLPPRSPGWGVCVGGREASVSEAMGAAVGTRPCRRAQ